MRIRKSDLASRCCLRTWDLEVLAAFPKRRSRIRMDTVSLYVWSQLQLRKEALRCFNGPEFNSEFLSHLGYFGCMYVHVHVSISWLRDGYGGFVVSSRHHSLCPHPRQAPHRSFFAEGCWRTMDRSGTSISNVDFLRLEWIQTFIKYHHMNHICTSYMYIKSLQLCILQILKVIHNMHLKPTYPQSHDKVMTKRGCLRCTSTLWPLLASGLESVGRSDSDTSCIKGSAHGSKRLEGKQHVSKNNKLCHSMIHGFVWK